MPRSLPLLHGNITLSAAKEKETNILHALGYWHQQSDFFSHLQQNRESIKSVVLHHLGLSSSGTCHVAEQNDWIHGSFNICIPITLSSRGRAPEKRLVIRFPLPYRVGEEFRPGNADEKLRCEAATYAWLQENCPDIPIPHLHGFGLSTGEKFTVLDNLPFFTRLVQSLRHRVLAWLGYQTPSRYIPHHKTSNNSTKLDAGYLLLDYIEEGSMLSRTWHQNRQKSDLRKNLFRGLSQILLAVARVPLPRIGSFIIDAHGYLSLSNRPLTLEIHGLENEKIPVDIPREATYSTADSYIHDMLMFHESRLYFQPNAVNDMEDCLYQMAALTIMKTVFPHFFQAEFRRGPFFLNLTDLHQSNIFVDDDWNIKCLVDLEWACSRPVGMIHPPYWLTNESVDGISLDAYEDIHNEFIEILKEEEQKLSRTQQITCLSQILEYGWQRGTFWYALALDSPTGLFTLFYDHIQPRFSKEHIDDPAFFKIIMAYWNMNAREFIDAKVRDKEEYDERLSAAFGH